MPLTPLNNDFLQCPICFGCFSADRRPVTLLCSHTCCSSCLVSLQNCPFDQTAIDSQLPENEAILSLLPTLGKDGQCVAASPASGETLIRLSERFGLDANQLVQYRKAVDCIKSLAQLLRPQTAAGCSLSRPMQRKLVALLHCQLVEGDGRLRAVKNARSIGERALSELLIKHQDPYTLSANLWAAVRSRGCQFLGPAMQEEILKLVLLALEEGSHLSRKVLVMFVVQRLSPHFPHQASKTAIGHVIQLLYRASCFRLTKRDGDSSLMQLKEEYCSYEALRREHDTQIVSIALESGLKISPDQWSSLLYGDTMHKSHMQSIIDKLQSPQSFHQSIQELIIALQRTQDPAGLIALKEHFERLAKIDPSLNGEDSSEPPTLPSLEELATILESCKLVTFRLIDFLRQHAGSCAGNARYAGRSSAYGMSGQKFKPVRAGQKPFVASNGGRMLGASEKQPQAQQPAQLLLNPSFESLSPQHSSGGPGTPVGQHVPLDSTAALLRLRELKHKPCAYVPPTVQQQQLASAVIGGGYGNFTKPPQPTQATASAQAPPQRQINVYKGSISLGKPSPASQPIGQPGQYSPQPFHRSSASQQQPVTRNSQLLKQMQAHYGQNGMSALNGVNNAANQSHLQNGHHHQLTSSTSLNSVTSSSSLHSLSSSNSANESKAAVQPRPLKQAQPTPVQQSPGITIPLVRLPALAGKTGKTALVGSFEDDQFIPFADQPFVSKYGPISRAMQLLETHTLTGCTANSANGGTDGPNSDVRTHLTNVMLGRTGMPSLTLIEPMQQLGIHQAMFADQPFQ